MTIPTASSLADAGRLLPKMQHPHDADLRQKMLIDRLNAYADERAPALALAIQVRDERIAELEGDLARYRDAVTLPELVDDGANYTTPEHGWTCFHCGVSFPGTTRGWQTAGHHFGWTPNMQPACRIAEEEGGLPRRLRAYEDGAKRDEKTIEAKDARIAALEAEALRLSGALTSAAEDLEAIAELTWDRKFMTRETCDEASGMASEASERTRAALSPQTDATPLTVGIQKDGES